MPKRVNSALQVEHKETHDEQQVALKEKPLEDPVSKINGIGIENFLHGKAVFITGATGFFAKVLIEKILRTMPGISKIYLMVRAKDKEEAKQRLKTEIVDVELFKCLKQKYGEHYETFMCSKLVPVVGNVGTSNLGMEEDLASEIAKEVQIIVNSVADTVFDQRYDVALQINTIGPCNLLNFANKCHKLELFLHISTNSVKRYSTQGRTMEKIFCMRDSNEAKPFISEKSKDIIPSLLVENEMKLASDYKKIFKDKVVTQKLKEFGLRRARKYGWRNTYGFTKALGEMLLDEMRGEIPIVIIRPSGIFSTYKEPFPGWIEGIKLADPVLLYYGKGMLTGFPINPNIVADFVPVDICVNATLAAMAKHVSMAKKADINVYHVCNSTSNPLIMEDLFTLTYKHFKSSPCIDSNGRPIQISKMKFFDSMQDFSAQLWKQVANLPNHDSTKSPVPNTRMFHEIIKFKELAEYLGTIYMPYNFQNYWFDDSNVQGLIKSMSEEEKKMFGCEVKSVDWKDFIVNVHIPGLRKHVLKEKGFSKM